MRKTQFIIFLFLSLMMGAACGREDVQLQYVGAPAASMSVRLHLRNSDAFRRHKDTPLKILAIGNSFTHNAATYLPWLVDQLNGDSICIAKLTRSGCSLSMHWNSHVDNTPDYDFHYSDGGDWHLSEITTIDDALMLFDWDIIVIQQQSGLSGKYSSYYPLPYLLLLFRETNPGVQTAWHITWPYTAATEHGDFAKYDRNPEKMYEEILEAGEKAASLADLKIPSATLIWEMRRQYPEVEGQFSTDGYHIDDPLALYALSTLWYECLIAPSTHTSALGSDLYPDGVDPAVFRRAKEILRRL